MRAFLLKLGATAATLLAAAGSAAYVTGHVKNGGAPLHPPVASAGAGAAVASAAGGRLSLSAGVRRASVEAVTSTYVS